MRATGTATPTVVICRPLIVVAPQPDKLQKHIHSRALFKPISVIVINRIRIVTTPGSNSPSSLPFSFLFLFFSLFTLSFCPFSPSLSAVLLATGPTTTFYKTTIEFDGYQCGYKRTLWYQFRPPPPNNATMDKS
ncbi:hypothetical protein LX36DRAFT_136497 [Colletotrichum falcatum]|nr:hypothetical protein LX36DRAFT_136497 [Colletotrichum falcatum]